MRSLRLTVPILLMPMLLLAPAMARGESWVETLGLPLGRPSDEEVEKLRAVEREEAAALVAALREAREGKELLARGGEWSRVPAHPPEAEPQLGAGN